jgi:hypothetical protein
MNDGRVSVEAGTLPSMFTYGESIPPRAEPRTRGRLDVNKPNKIIVAVLAGVFGLGAGVLLLNLVTSRDGTPGSIQTGGALSPGQELLSDALRISAARQGGGDRPFPYLPETRPADLTHMSAGGSGDATVDTYKVKDEDFSIFVAFSVEPMTLCQNLRTGEVSGLCVRDQTLNLPPADGKNYRHLTVYFTSRTGGPLDTADPEVAAAREYWHDVEMVPADNAVWFTDLVARARAATAD